MLKQIFLVSLYVMACAGCAGTPTPGLPLMPSPTVIITLTPEQPPRPSPIPSASNTPAAPATPSLTPTQPSSPSASLTAPPTSTFTPTLVAPQPLEGNALLQTLQRGGYSIVFRHAVTDQSQSDTVPQVLEDCAKQRNLNEQGRTQARAIGAAISTLKIPIGVVLSSPYCRTRETAELAFGKAETTSRLDNAFINVDRRPELQEALRQLVVEPPLAGTNTVLVTHGDNMSRALGVTVVEGEAVVVQRDGSDGFRIIARLKSAEWQELDTP